MSSKNGFIKAVSTVVIGLGAIALIVAASSKSSGPVRPANSPADFTVMITNLEENSGGSGSIIFNSPTKSLVLTNSHVCEVLDKNGGLVIKENGQKFLADGYKKSDMHDLCAITVSSDLGASVKLAITAPQLQDKAIVTGHPALLPHILSEGNFSGNKIIQIMTGIKPCSQKDLENPENGMYCMFFGGLPVITNYESTVISSLIMGGSSGSAVLNASGELSGVVFAGQGKGLSFGFIVPYQYVAAFVTEILSKPYDIVKVPLKNNENNEKTEEKAIKERMRTACKLTPKLVKICSILERDLE